MSDKNDPLNNPIMAELQQDLQAEYNRLRIAFQSTNYSGCSSTLKEVEVVIGGSGYVSNVKINTKESGRILELSTLLATNEALRLYDVALKAHNKMVDEAYLRITTEYTKKMVALLPEYKGDHTKLGVVPAVQHISKPANNSDFSLFGGNNKKVPPKKSD